MSYVCYTSYLLLKEKHIFACWTLNLRGLCVAELLKVAFTYTRNEIGFDIAVVELVFLHIKHLTDFWQVTNLNIHTEIDWYV